jgi:hypothetical protein
VVSEAFLSGTAYLEECCLCFISSVVEVSLRTEDDVHSRSSDDHICHGAEGRPLVFHIVDAIVAHAHEVDVVLRVLTLRHQEILDALVYSFGRRFLKNLDLLLGVVELAANRSHGTLDRVELDSILFDSYNGEIVFRSHYRKNLAERAFGSVRGIECDRKAVFVFILRRTEPCILHNDNGIVRFVSEELNSGPCNSRVPRHQ